MDESLASGSDNPIKEIAKLSLNKISDIFVMIKDIVFDSLCDDRAQGAFIVESLEIKRALKIHIGALRVQFLHPFEDLLKVLSPLFLNSHFGDFF